MANPCVQPGPKARCVRPPATIEKNPALALARQPRARKLRCSKPAKIPTRRPLLGVAGRAGLRATPLHPGAAARAAWPPLGARCSGVAGGVRPPMRRWATGCTGTTARLPAPGAAARGRVWSAWQGYRVQSVHLPQRLHGEAPTRSGQHRPGRVSGRNWASPSTNAASSSPQHPMSPHAGGQACQKARARVGKAGLPHHLRQHRVGRLQNPVRQDVPVGLVGF